MKRALEGKTVKKNISIISFFYNLLSLFLILLILFLYIAFIPTLLFAIYHFALAPFAEMTPVVFALTFLYIVLSLVGFILFLLALRHLLPPYPPTINMPSVEIKDEPLFADFIDEIVHFAQTFPPVKLLATTNLGVLHFNEKNPIIPQPQQMKTALGILIMTNFNIAEMAAFIAKAMGYFSRDINTTLLRMIATIHRYFPATNNFEFEVSIIQFFSTPWLYPAIPVLSSLFELSKKINEFFAQLIFFVSRSSLIQLEKNTDEYAIQLIGAERFAHSLEKLQLLKNVNDECFLISSAAFKEELLIKNISQYVALEFQRALEEKRKPVFEEMSSWENFDYYYSLTPLQIRLNFIRRSSEKGIYWDDKPFSSLFNDFSKLGEELTSQIYENFDVNFNQYQYISPEKLFIRKRKQLETRETLIRYFQGIVRPNKPFILNPDDFSPLEWDEARNQLFQLRTSISQSINSVRGALQQYLQVVDEYEWLIAKQLFHLQIFYEEEILDRPEFLPLRNQLEKLKGLIQENEKEIEQYEKKMRERLLIALHLLKTERYIKEDSDAIQGQKQLDIFLDAYKTMESVYPNIMTFWKNYSFFLKIKEMAVAENRYEDYYEDLLLKLWQDFNELIEILRTHFALIPYPFREEDSPLTLGRYLVGDYHEDDMLFNFSEMSKELLERFFFIQIRLLAELVFWAEKVEAHFGWKSILPNEDLNTEWWLPSSSN